MGVVAMLLCACGQNGGGWSWSGSGAAAAAPTPIILDVTPEMEEAAKAAHIQTVAHDAACADMSDLAPGLDETRPSAKDGKKGCPRPGPAESIDAWGAQ